MKLGDVLRKERVRKKLTVADISSKLGLSEEAYEEIENGTSPVEEWGAKLAEIAIKLSAPTSRLISETGKSPQAGQCEGQCGRLIKMHRGKRGLSQEEFSKQLGWSTEQLTFIENGESPLERFAPLLLRFAEIIDQPIFNLFYPCGLQFAELKDYP